MVKSSDKISQPHMPQVVLLNDDLSQRGVADREEVHSTSTPLHLAFSLYIFNEHNEVLLTRRAACKRSWPGTWTNSCCGHPEPTETMEDSIVRRVREELNLDIRNLPLIEAIPDFRYQARDPQGIEENEFCPVYCCRISNTVLSVNRSEVGSYHWASWKEVVRTAGTMGFLLSPWSRMQIIRMSNSLRPEFDLTDF